MSIDHEMPDDAIQGLNDWHDARRNDEAANAAEDEHVTDQWNRELFRRDLFGRMRAMSAVLAVLEA